MDQRTLVHFKAKGVEFLRTNMCHSSLEDLQRAITLAKQIGIPFMIDTEGPQVRTGNLKGRVVHFRENSTVEIWSKPIDGDQRAISIRPSPIVRQLEEGDLLHIDFDTLILRVCDTSTASDGFIRARTVTTGTIGRNKAVVIDPVMERKLDLPALSGKDLEAIAIGLQEGIGHVALSFVRSALDIDEIRRVTENQMKIIAKIECREALRNLDDIIEAADFLLIDRGDLGKEVPIERIPFIQRIIISRAKEQNVEVFVATNLLESMVERRSPTRSEAHDVVDTVLDGAAGLTLAAETAMGRYPIECVNMMDRLIRHAEEVAHLDPGGNTKQARAVHCLDGSDYLLGAGESSGLIRPHGGRLVTRVVSPPDEGWLQSLATVSVRDEQRREVEQIAIGTYSPLEGFMGEQDFCSVLNRMRLSDGTVWPIPIVLDVSSRMAADLSVGQDVALVSDDGERFAVLHLEDKFPFPRREAILRLYGTTSRAHPGVGRMLRMESILLGGKIDLIRRRQSATRQYELSPRQVRHLFDEKGWHTVLGFHSHNGSLPTHEIVKVELLADNGYDGFLVHPIIECELNAALIVKRWEATARRHLPSKKLVFAVWPVLPRHACARDALFTALCRKNFGCSHFIAAGDAARFNGYALDALPRLFDQFDDLGIALLMHDEVACEETTSHFFSDEKVPA
jgi:pyruvate kinase